MTETNPQRNAEETSAGESPWTTRALYLAILLAGGVALSPTDAGPDLWGHVRYGEDVLATGELPATTTYSYAVDNYRWINHENLAELAFAVGANTIGASGMLAIKCLLGMAMLAFMIRHAQRQGASLIIAGGIALLVATNLAFHWSVRPQLFSYCCFALMLAMLGWCFQGWEGRWNLRLPGSKQAEPPVLTYSSRRLRYLWLMPVLFFFWANSHGGFVAGFGIYTVYLGLRSIEALSCRGSQALGLVGRFAFMLAAAGAATLINPYGPSLHLWLLDSLGSPRPEILEWWPPNMFQMQSLPLWLMLGLWAAGLLFSGKKRDFTHVVIMSLILWQALSHQRHIGFFSIVFGFWIAPHIDSLLRRSGMFAGAPRPAQAAPYMKWVFAGVFIAAYGLLGFKLYERLSELRVGRRSFPVSALQYIADEQLNGKMVVTYNWAQYVIAAFGPRDPGEPGILVGFDGRFRTCYPQQIVDINFDLILGNDRPEARHRSIESPPFDGGGHVLEYRNPDLVLISRFQTHSPQVLERHRDRWALLYQDEMAQLWGRKTKYDDPLSPNYLPPSRRRVTDQPQEGYVAWPALPVRGQHVGRLANN